MTPSPNAVALSTASVYPETTATAFEMAVRLGYDAVEVMVGIDETSQDIAQVKHLSEYHEIPVCAVHAPVPADHPAGLGHRPLGQARDQRRDGARGGRRRRGRAPAVPLAARLRPRVRRGHRAAGGADRHRLRGGEHVPLAGLAPRDAGLRPALGPGRVRLRQHHARRLARRHRPGGLPGAGQADGRRRCATCTSPTAPAAPRTSTSSPVAATSRSPSCSSTSPPRGFAGHVVLEVNTRRSGSRSARESDLMEGLAFTRLHFAAPPRSLGRQAVTSTRTAVRGRGRAAARRPRRPARRRRRLLHARGPAR